MAGRYFLRPRRARLSSISSMSSRNLRNMIQVSMGRRSRSPERPLSLRMMSRADLMREPSCCAVVGWLGLPGAMPFVFFRAMRSFNFCCSVGP